MKYILKEADECAKCFEEKAWVMKRGCNEASLNAIKMRGNVFIFYQIIKCSSYRYGINLDISQFWLFLDTLKYLTTTSLQYSQVTLSAIDNVIK